MTEGQCWMLGVGIAVGVLIVVLIYLPAQIRTIRNSDRTYRVEGLWLDTQEHFAEKDDY